MVGIILENLEGNEKATELIDWLNSTKEDVMVFVENLSRPHLPTNFSYFPSSYIWDFKGVLISTSISQVEYISKIKRKNKHYYYAWDLDWKRPWGKQFHQIFPLLKNTPIVVRSEDHARELENYTQKDVEFIAKDFETLLEKINGQE